MNDNGRVSKRALREKYLSLRDRLGVNEIGIKSAAVAEFFLSTGEYARCADLFIYMNMGSEVATKKIIDDALARGKRVALPYMTDRALKEMVFIEIFSTDGLIKNSFGVAEPRYDEKKIIAGGAGALVAAPGVAFTKGMGRAGYGGGYYDRWLSMNEYMSCVGLCFEIQLAENIPARGHDVTMDAVVTELGVYRSNASLHMSRFCS